MILTVLYEDQATNGDVTNYRPHMLALACVSDSLSLNSAAYVLRKYAVAVPSKGDANLRAKLRGLAGHRALVAVFDNDHVRDLYKLPAGASNEDVTSAVRADAGANAEIVLIESNMDDMVAASCDVLQRRRFGGKPTPEQRDSVLLALAMASSAQRTEFLSHEPSFQGLVSALHSHIQSELLRDTDVAVLAARPEPLE